MDHRWVILLAGGEGGRVRNLTYDLAGRPAPKQFSCLRGHRTLLELALVRACTVAPEEQIVPVVQESQRRWWSRDLAGLPARNVVVQRENRGTAVAVLRGVQHVLDRDPEAEIVILPSDHDAEDEDVFCESISLAADAASVWARRLILLGMEPEEPDPSYGWIVPSRVCYRETTAIEAFYEKPDPREAQRLADAGALINAFVVAGTGSALAELFRLALPELVLSEGLGAQDGDLPHRDFSNDLLARSVGRLRVLRSPGCGWTDLGTPERLHDWQLRHEALAG